MSPGLRCLGKVGAGARLVRVPHSTREGGGGMPGAAFPSGTEGCARASSRGGELSDVKKSSGGNCSRAKAGNSGEVLRVFPGMPESQGS